MRAVVLAFASVLCLSSIASAQPQPPAKLTQPEILQLLSGKTMKARNAQGQDYSQGFNPSGALTGESTRSASDPSLIRDTGQWWLANNQLCIRWSSWQRGSTNCFDVERMSD